jgi:hypothetical protein
MLISETRLSSPNQLRNLHTSHSPQVTSPCVRAVECPMLLMASAAPTITWLPLNVAIVDNDRGGSPSSYIYIARA